MSSGLFFSSKNGKKTDDEYYTRMEDVEKILKPFNLKGKRVYMPCDDNRSNFSLYCYLNDINYLFTSDDYKNHEKQFNECDIIITNPPFSK